MTRSKHRRTRRSRARVAYGGAFAIVALAGGSVTIAAATSSSFFALSAPREEGIGQEAPVAASRSTPRAAPSTALDVGDIISTPVTDDHFTDTVEAIAEAPFTLATPTELSLESFMSQGVVNWGGYKFTYYSESVLPGTGLSIPGRHLNDAGYVCDEDGYIVLAGSADKGTVYDTPFGFPGKIYDRGTSGNHLDVYIR